MTVKELRKIIKNLDGGTKVNIVNFNKTKETKILWVTMLALSNRYGEVAASLPGIAHAASLTMEETVRSLKVLESPDPYSRTTVSEGRRIVKVDGGWQIINYTTYRERGRGADRREYLRVKQQESRARRKACQQNVNNVNQGQPIAEAEAEAIKGKPPLLTNPDKIDKISKQIRLDRSFGKCCYHCGRSANEGRFVWRERLPFCQTSCHTAWVTEGKPQLSAR